MATTRFTDALLNPLRALGDPAADEMARAVFQTESVDVVNAMLRHLDDNNELLPASMPPAARAFLDKTAVLPPWIRRDQVELGEHLFGRYAPQIICVLHCASLPKCYAAKKGVQVLAATKRMEEYTYRRIMETAQFIMDVMAPGGLGPQGHGVRSAQKVRVLHAAIRYLLLREGKWNPAYDHPINQEDLAGTLMSFTVVTIESLEKIGIGLTAREKEAYVHLWNVVGYLLGIDRRVMPSNYAESKELTDAIERRHFAPCPEGQAMAKALVEYMEYMTPGNLFDGFPATLMRHLCGDPLADMLAVPKADWTRTLLHPFTVLSGATDEAGDHSKMFAKVTEVVGRKMLESLQYVMRGGQRYQVRIPKSVREKWGISEIG